MAHFFFVKNLLNSPLGRTAPNAAFWKKPIKHKDIHEKATRAGSRFGCRPYRGLGWGTQL
jgi:hypothetical protein